MRTDKAGGNNVDHDQFFKRMMHLFLREFFELFFAEMVSRFDFDRV